jgi:hypothetical protein
MHLWRIANNQIAEHWCNNDDLGVMRQPGGVSWKASSEHHTEVARVGKLIQVWAVGTHPV